MGLFLSIASGVLTYIIMLGIVSMLGLGDYYFQLLAGNLDNESIVPLLIILLLVPTFVGGVVAGISSRGIKAGLKTSILAGFIIPISSGITFALIGFLLGFGDMIAYSVWTVMSTPLQVAISVVGSIAGYIIILIYILAKK